MFLFDLVHALLFNPKYVAWLSILLLAWEAALSSLIVAKVPYTEIDWVAYMQEVGEANGFLSGQRDYSLMKGDTGPLVYPAGFVYLYSGLYYITNKGADIFFGQSLFIGVYVLFVAFDCFNAVEAHSLSLHAPVI
eukprot:gb/GEZN01019961.1/.p1 GENE.gb/GEZN01019961.1/~~gb/GEZN01019961.1/.p1  ORF type:complete len:135 (+),score=18.72 gb/GEZN01019961.1/:105-509(+)